MNESQTRIDKIDPALKLAGWSVVEDSRIITEYNITNGRISKASKPKALKADYILSYKGVKLAIVEAKSDEKDVSEGVAQAKLYAEMLDIRFTYATNGDKIYAIDMQSGEEDEISAYPSPQELWEMISEMLMNGVISSMNNLCIQTEQSNRDTIRRLP